MGGSNIARSHKKTFLEPCFYLFSQTEGWAANGEGWGTSGGGGGSFDRQTSVQSQGGDPQGVLPPSASQEGVAGGEGGAVPAGGDQLKAVALYSFESQNADELTVTENEEVTVILGRKRFHFVENVFGIFFWVFIVIFVQLQLRIAE